MRGSLFSTTILLFVGVVACQADQPQAPPTTPSVTSTPAAAPTDTSAPAAATAAPTASATDTATSPVATPTPSDANDYKTCAADSDCEAVDRAGCCNNGFKEAIAHGKGDAYRKANACTKKVMCPQYIVRDTRTVACNATKHECEMVGRAP
jgi:hypothetical protein